MITDHIRNWDTYKLGPLWEKAFAFLESLDAESEERRYDLDGEKLFGIVMSYPTIEANDPKAILETHRKYADIQMTLDGAERFAIYPSHTLSTKIGYDAGRDAEFYHCNEPADMDMTLRDGKFALLLPQDAHMPQLTASEPGVVVKKVVVKVLLEALEL